MDLNSRLVTAEEMRLLEAEEVAAGSSYEELMERAGLSAADIISQWAGPGELRRVLVLAGPGNNGGDALVVARHLADRGFEVECRTLLREPARRADLVQQLKARGVTPAPLEDAEDITHSLASAQFVVDGIFGTGLQRDVNGLVAEVVAQVNRSGKPVLSIDLPTGVDSDTGAVRGQALRSKMTVVLAHLKYGHTQPPGKILSGKIIIGDIGLSAQETSATGRGELLTNERVRGLLPERPEDANKGTFGKAMVVAGSVNYIGAAALAVQGAMRSGAGLVTLGCPGDLLPIMALKLTECTFLPLPSDLGALATPAADKVKDGVEGYTALLVGCGLGTEKETSGFLKRLLAGSEGPARSSSRSLGFATRRGPEEQSPEPKTGGTLPPLVLDGDALNIIAQWEDFSKSLPSSSVLTPHPGEMARLLGNNVEEVQADRVGTARRAAEQWGQVVVLKGAGTVIAAPTGELSISPFANPALATAGTGDVLAGVIVGLMAQGLAPIDAARLGVYLHGMAGEALRAKYGPSGGLAGELPVLVARARNTLEQNDASNGR
ncbi:MAG TPA: NAD(P)H-hydrate epimerase [Chloroflexia bacterium]|nr:NAD(P)H-hydrate epimerase [Chloroflexia bacterium]